MFLTPSFYLSLIFLFPITDRQSLKAVIYIASGFVPWTVIKTEQPVSLNVWLLFNLACFKFLRTLFLCSYVFLKGLNKVASDPCNELQYSTMQYFILEALIDKGLCSLH